MRLKPVKVQTPNNRIELTVASALRSPANSSPHCVEAAAHAERLAVAERPRHRESRSKPCRYVASWARHRRQEWL